jgi:hypothetical protein
LIRIVVPLAVSRHGGKLGRKQVSDAVKVAMRGKLLAKRVYRTTLTPYGNWYQKNGDPRKRDTDSVCVVLFDAIAKHGGLPGDQWLHGHGFTVNRPVQSDVEQVVVDLV